MKPKFRYLCNTCAFSGRYEITDISLAHRPDRLPDAEENILVCPRLIDLRPIALLRLTKTRCEDCGITIYYDDAKDAVLHMDTEGRPI